VIPAEFEYAAPESLEEAIRLLTSGDHEAKLLAGGHSLLPLMKLRLASPTLLVDLRRVPGMCGIARTNGDFSIGPLTRHADLASHSELGLAARTAGLIADQQVRNRGTIGGSLAHGDPAADLPAVLLACEGSVVARGPHGERQINAADLFLGDLMTALEPGEIITRVVIPDLPGYGFHYEKFTRRSEDWAIVGVAALLAVRDGVCADARVGLTNMGSTPLRAAAVENSLIGNRLDRDAIARAADLAGDRTQPQEDLNSTGDYKRHLTRVLTRRALERAVQDAAPDPRVRPARFRDRRAPRGAAPDETRSSGDCTSPGDGGGIQLKHSFDVEAPLGRVWSSFVNLERVAPCLPGAVLTGAENGVYHGEFRVKVGPASAVYRGQVKLESADEATHILVMTATGQDTRGQGSAGATITVRINDARGRTHVDVASTVTITGTLARFGRSGMIEDVANLVFDQFASCVASRLTGKTSSSQSPPRPLRGGSLMMTLLRTRVKRILSRIRRIFDGPNDTQR
jgi:aerobic carbon-monoxide dehydrogenase medium subunit